MFQLVGAILHYTPNETDIFSDLDLKMVFNLVTYRILLLTNNSPEPTECTVILGVYDK